MVRYGRKGSVDSLLQDRRDGDVPSISTQNEFFVRIGYLRDRRLAQGLLKLLKSRGIFLSPHLETPFCLRA